MRKLIRNFFVVNFLIEFSFCFFAQSFNAENDALFILRVRNRTFANDETLTFNSREYLRRTAFNPQKPVIFQVHGFDLVIPEIEESLRKLNLLDLIARNDYTNYFHSVILDKFDANLFYVDWSQGAKTLDYNLAKNRVYEVARALGRFIKYLHESHGVDNKNVTCIGFSLGAHICGIAGQHLECNKIGKVVGLDPAGPLFDVNDSSTRINSNSADYVECIHTGYFLGIRAPVCQADFFMNRGSNQPGCINIFGMDNVVCSHYRAIWYYIEALQKPEAFHGKSCSNFQNVLSGSCNGDSGEFMGNLKNAERKVRGMFQVFTNRFSPFGRGRN